MPIPEEWNLSDKSAIITADRRGWTPFLASALAEAGADVAIAGSVRSDAADAAKAVEEQGRRALNITTDIMNADDVEAMTQRVVDEFGKVDILVNNASAEFGKPFEDVLESEWQTLMDFNVKSMYLCSQAVGKRMLAQESGHIVNIGSGLAVRGLWNSVAACAAAGAVHQITMALALEWSRRGIRVNGIGAGWIRPKSRQRSRSANFSYATCQPAARDTRPTYAACSSIWHRTPATSLRARQSS